MRDDRRYLLWISERRGEPIRLAHVRHEDGVVEVVDHGRRSQPGERELDERRSDRECLAIDEHKVISRDRPERGEPTQREPYEARALSNVVARPIDGAKERR